MAAQSCGAHNGRAAPMRWFVHSGARSCGMHRLLQAFGLRTTMIGTRYSFKWKDYRLEGRERYQVMTLTTDEFIRRFLMHVLPAGFHRIRYYGLLASGKRADNIARARELLTLPMIPVDAIKAANTNADQPQTPEHRCPCCGGRMIIIERFERGATPRSHPSPPTP